MWPFNKKIKKQAKRTYAGAQFGRLFSDWITAGTSVDSEIRTSLPKLRDRSRQLVRDDNFARNAKRAVITNVIGQGVGFQSQVRMQRGGKLDQRVNDQIETAWAKWCKKQNCHTAGTLNFDDIERLIMGSIFESGEVIIRIITQKMGDSNIPMALETLESDLLDHNYNAVLENGNVIKMGVELSPWNRPVAYHFFTQHPGDDGIRNTSIGPRRIRIPAEEIIHLFIQERPGQTRGVPWLAAALTNIHHLSGYIEGEVINARARSNLMGFIESEEGEVQSDDVQNNERVTEFEPGVFKYLAPGEKVTVPQMGSPSGQFDPFVRAMLRGISASIGVSYETLSKDYSQSNYSSTRQALLEDRDQYRMLQGWLINNFHTRVFDKWLDLAVLSGEVRLKNYELSPDAYKMPRWMPRGWSWIDPLKEITAAKDSIRAGLSTMSDVIAQQGGDFEELMQQRKRELDLAKELGLVFDSDPNATDMKGQDQPDQIEVNPSAENGAKE